MRFKSIKKYLENPANVRKVEWGFTTFLYLGMLLFLLVEADLNDTHKADFDRVKWPFNYYGHFFFPSLARYTVSYLTFLLFNFWLIPGMVKHVTRLRMLLYALLAFCLVGLVFGLCDFYLLEFQRPAYPTDEAFRENIFQSSFLEAFLLIAGVGLYAAIKSTVVYLTSRNETEKRNHRTFTKDVLSVLVLWIISLVLLLFAGADDEILAGWSLIVLTAIPIYSFAFYRSIPILYGRKQAFLAYLFQIGSVIVASNLLIGLLLMQVLGQAEAALNYALFNAAFQLALTAPLAWLLYGRYKKGRQEVLALQIELDQSHASFDFLRSQINPHFLFNALNTIYGTALMEKASRTGEAVEKLADMMRFMLHENMQDRIRLAREIDYLTNYVDLQRLRTDDSLTTITIQTDLEPAGPGLELAPMLLLPFVENAFKHGLSLQEPAYIHVSLVVRGGTLRFEVRNSKNLQPANDPGKDKSGIGLLHVRQRLRAIYPDQHQLVIRETLNEFFIQLVIQLVP